jgi:hypothetical protein
MCVEATCHWASCVSACLIVITDLGYVRVQMPEMLQCTPDLNSQRVDAAPQWCEPQSGVYRGFCLRGKPDGRGEWIGDDGHSYTGEWQGGQQHGRGKEVAPNGDASEGEFRSGKTFRVTLRFPSGFPSDFRSAWHWFSTGPGFARSGKMCLGFPKNAWVSGKGLDDILGFGKTPLSAGVQVYWSVLTRLTKAPW